MTAARWPGPVIRRWSRHSRRKAPMKRSLQQARGLSSLDTGLVFVADDADRPRADPVHRTAGRAVRAPLAHRDRTGGDDERTGRAALLSATTPPWALGPLMILVGLGGPLVMPPTMAVLLD
jgi:MFS transporter, DHA2 family, methylenomycin A resistance protein